MDDDQVHLLEVMHGAIAVLDANRQAQKLGNIRQSLALTTWELNQANNLF